jgi:hypothetical protein
MAQFLGIVEIVWKGRKIPVEKGATIMVGGLQANAVTHGKQVGYAHEYVPSEVKVTTHLARGQRFSDLYSAGEGELQVLCDTGQTFVFADAFLSGERPTITSGEGGKIELTWAAGEPEELLNG